jgi:hypothetical protein
MAVPFLVGAMAVLSDVVGLVVPISPIRRDLSPYLVLYEAVAAAVAFIAVGLIYLRYREPGAPCEGPGGSRGVAESGPEVETRIQQARGAAQDCGHSVT